MPEQLLRNDEQGFTLVELLTVAAIVGVLVTSAMFGFIEYKRRSFDARAISDFRNIISAQESYYSNSEAFAPDVASLVSFANANPSIIRIITSTGEEWSGAVFHQNGSKTFCYKSFDNKGIVTINGTDEECPP